MRCTRRDLAGLLRFPVMSAGVGVSGFLVWALGV